MELKTLVYIIVGIIWLLSKLVSGDEKRQKAPPMRKSPVPQPSPVRPARTERKKPTRPERLPYNKAVSLEDKFFTTSPKNVDLQAGVVMANVVEIPDSYSITDSDLGEYTYSGSVLAEEIRNGNINWKRELIISELIQRKPY